MRRAQNRARSARSRKNGARSRRSKIPEREARNENVPVKRADFLVHYYYKICQFYSIRKKSQCVILCAKLDIM